MGRGEKSFKLTSALDSEEGADFIASALNILLKTKPKPQAELFPHPEIQKGSFKQNSKQL